MFDLTDLAGPVWCITCQHEHVADIPQVTFMCTGRDPETDGCGFGVWRDEVANDHATEYPEHIVYAVHHQTVPIEHRDNGRWEATATADGWQDADGTVLRESATQAVAWALIEQTMDTAHEGPSQGTWHDAVATADRILDTVRPSGERRQTRMERDLLAALVHTVEYVGHSHLPMIEGWSWWDALRRHAPEVAERFVKDEEVRRRHAAVPVAPAIGDPATEKDNAHE